MKRVQLMVEDEDYDRFADYFYDGIRSTVIRNLIVSACDAIEGTDDVSVDMVIRGKIRVIGDDDGEV